MSFISITVAEYVYIAFLAYVALVVLVAWVFECNVRPRIYARRWNRNEVHRDRESVV